MLSSGACLVGARSLAGRRWLSVRPSKPSGLVRSVALVRGLPPSMGSGVEILDAA